MKQMTGQLFGMAAGGMAVFFCLYLLLGTGSGNGVLKMAQILAGQKQQIEIFSESGSRMEKIMELPAPQVMILPEVYRTGEQIYFWSELKVRETETDGWTSVAETETVRAEILDITDKAGKSLGKEIFAADIGAAEEIHTAASCDRVSGRLCFYQGGCYVLRVKVTGAYGRYTVKQIKVLVETS